MAGLGRKTFTAGDVLTAAQVQGYLQDQAVMVFAGTAARSSAIATPSEGMFAVMTDTDQLTYYTGTDWNVVAPLNNPTIVDSTNYPNQIVNVNSGVSRPVAYATNVGSNSITGSGTVTFTAGRFTQTPIVLATVSSTNNTRTSVTVAITGTTSVTFYVWSGTTASTSAAAVGWQAIQQTSAATSG
jgi:hypothetical protein